VAASIPNLTVTVAAASGAFRHSTNVKVTE